MAIEYCKAFICEFIEFISGTVFIYVNTRSA